MSSWLVLLGLVGIGVVAGHVAGQAMGGVESAGRCEGAGAGADRPLRWDPMSPRICLVDRPHQLN